MELRESHTLPILNTVYISGLLFFAGFLIMSSFFIFVKDKRSKKPKIILSNKKKIVKGKVIWGL